MLFNNKAMYIKCTFVWIYKGGNINQKLKFFYKLRSLENYWRLHEYPVDPVVPKTDDSSLYHALHARGHIFIIVLEPSENLFFLFPHPRGFLLQLLPVWIQAFTFYYLQYFVE